MSMFWVGVVVVSVGADLTKHASESAARAAEKTSAYNALEKRRQAGQELKVASENARRKEQDSARIMAALRAQNAASGTTSEGSPMVIFGDTYEQLQREVFDISFEAESRRRALLAGADLDLMEGANVAAGMRNEATASGISSVAGMFTGGAQAKGYFGG